MKAQVIRPTNNTFSFQVTDNSESIKESYKFLMRPNGKPLSTQDKQLLDLVKQLISKGTDFIDYPWLRDKLDKSNKTLNRIFNNISLYFIGKFENKYVQDGIEYFNKIILTETIECKNLLDEALVKLANSKCKRGDKTVHLGRQNCPPRETKLSTPLHIYRDNKRKQIDRSDQICVNSVEVSNFQPEPQTLPQQENIAITETLEVDQPVQTEEFSKDYLEFCAKRGMKPRKELPTVVPKEPEEPATPEKKTEYKPNAIRRNRELDKPLSALLPLSDDVILAGIKQTGRDDLNIGKARGIVDCIAEKYPDKLIYGGRESTLIKYLGIVLKHEREEVEYESYRGKKNETDALMEYAYKRAEQIRKYGIESLNYAY